jgi:hypothetical protein
MAAGAWRSKSLETKGIGGKGGLWAVANTPLDNSRYNEYYACVGLRLQTQEVGDD